MFERKLVGMAPAARLGIMRVIISLSALLAVISVPLAGFTKVSIDWLKPVGVLQWVPSPVFMKLFNSPELFLALQVLLVVFLLLTMAGIFSRISVFAAAVLFTFYAGMLRSYGTLFNTGFILVYLLFILSLLPCGAGFSCDAKRKSPSGSQPDLQPDVHFAWGTFLLRAVVALSCLFAAYAKIYHSGFSWFQHSNLKNYLLQEVLQSGNFEGSVMAAAFHLPKVFWLILTTAVFICELLFPMVLLSWHFRNSFAFFFIGVQAVLAVLCPPLALDAICISLLALLCFDWDRILLTSKLPTQDRRRRGY